MLSKDFAARTTSSEFMSIYAQFLLQHRASEALYISMYALVTTLVVSSFMYGHMYVVAVALMGGLQQRCKDAFVN